MRIRKGWLWIAGLVVAAAYFASGVYLVQPDERGVVRWFGRVPLTGRKVPPGVHYVLPWPLCRVNRPKTMEVQRVYVGLNPDEREAIAAAEFEAMQASRLTDMLTGDVNILKVTMVVQYQIADAVAYLFEVTEPDRLVQDTVESVLIEHLAGLAVDEALTVAKTRLQAEVLSRAQRLLDDYGCGVRLVAANLEAIEPPQAIIAAFQDVVSAKKDGEKAVDRAAAEANRILPRARGEVAQIGEEAEAYRRSRVSRSRGEAARFLSVLVEYRKNKEVFEKRLLLQTLETVLPRLRTFVLDHQPGDAPADVRIIETTGGESP